MPAARPRLGKGIKVRGVSEVKGGGEPEEPLALTREAEGRRRTEAWPVGLPEVLLSLLGTGARWSRLSQWVTAPRPLRGGCGGRRRPGGLGCAAGETHGLCAGRLRAAREAPP